MATSGLTITEAFNSRTFNDLVKNGKRESQLECIFYITGSDDPSDLTVQAMGPQAQAQYGSQNLYVVNRRFEVYQQATSTQSGCVKLTVTYGDPDKLEDPPEFNLELSTQSAHIERALPTSVDPSAGPAETPFGNPSVAGGLINVNEGRVEGTDIQVPCCNYSQTGWYSFTDEEFQAFVGYIEWLVGCVNDAPFALWDTGEVLFLGCNITRSGNGDYRITFKFSVSQKQTLSIPILGSSNASVAQGGWEHIWFQRAQQSAGGSNPVLQNGVIGGYVDCVYYEASFEELTTYLAMGN
jgi:hypothetical protein